MARGLSSAESPRHFVMTRVEDEQAWRELGIEPVFHPTSLGDPEGALCESISRLVADAGERVVEQRSRIQELASRLPSELNREQTDLVADALSDDVRRKFFTHAADSPKWIAWLDDRKCLDSLFGHGTLSAGDHELAQWLAERFVYGGAQELFTLIGKHGTKLHIDFWRYLLWQARMPIESLTDTDCLERWVSVLLSTTPKHINGPSALALSLLGECCIEHGLTDSVMEIFAVLATNRLILQELPSWRRSAGESNLAVDAELSPLAGAYELRELWQKGLQPQLPRIINRLFPILVENLAKQHRTLRIWGKASQYWDPISFRRSAIESHPQDRYPNVADVAINAARECLQWLAKHERDITLYWCRQLLEEQVPILRRLAVHTLTELSDASDFGPNEKIDWLLSRVDINDDDVHHEIFRAMQFMYPHASRSRRQGVVGTVLDFQLPKEEDPDGGIVAYARFNWFHWLHGKAPDCDLARKELDKVQAEHPEFRPREHPDLHTWSCTGGIAQRVELHSPWSADQLLAEPAKRWVSTLLEYRPDESPFSGFQGGRRGILEQVAEAAKRSFDWGVNLADALAGNEEWKADLWAAVLPAWAQADEDKILKRRALRHLSQDELRSEHFATIADLLYAWARSGKHAGLLTDADGIAADLWSILPGDAKDIVLTDGVPDWMNTAINRPPGVLAQFWLERFYPSGLRGECEAALSAIARDPGISGTLGRTVLAYSFPELLSREEAWTQENLLPFFEWHKGKDIEDCQAVWDGFLFRAYIDDRMFPLMENAFRVAAERLQDKRCFLVAELREQFLSVCAMIMTEKRWVPNPLQGWLAQVLRNCSAQDKGIFVGKIGEFLEQMKTQEREELWRRWLMEYWRRREHGAIAGSLTQEETTGMFHWLPLLHSVAFEEAVALATRTTPRPNLQHGSLFRELDEAGLCEEQPEATARLLVYLGEDEFAESEYVWTDGGKLIKKLLALKIPQVLKHKLEDLAVLPKFTLRGGNAA